MIKWEAIESSDKYTSLPPDQKVAVRQGYFNEFVAPSERFQSLPDTDKEKFVSKFIGSVEPELTPGRAVGKAFHSLKSGVGDIARGVGESLAHTELTGDLLPTYGIPEEKRPDIGGLELNPEIVEGLNRYREKAADKMIGLSKSPAFKMPEKYKPSSGFLEDVIGAGFGSLPMMGAAVVGPTAAMVTAYHQILGAEYAEKIERGDDPEKAFVASSLSSLAQAPIETAGNLLQLGAIGKLFKPTGNKAVNFLKVLMQTSAAEGIEEYLQSYPSEIADTYSKNSDKDPDEIAKLVADRLTSGDFHRQAAYSAGVGAAVGGITGGVGQVAATTTDVIKRKVDKPKQEPEPATPEITPQETKPDTSFVDKVKTDYESGKITDEQVGKIADSPRVADMGLSDQVRDLIKKPSPQAKAQASAQAAVQAEEEAAAEVEQTLKEPEPKREYKQQPKTFERPVDPIQLERELMRDELLETPQERAADARAAKRRRDAKREADKRPPGYQPAASKIVDRIYSEKIPKETFAKTPEGDELVETGRWVEPAYVKEEINELKKELKTATENKKPKIRSSIDKLKAEMAETVKKDRGSRKAPERTDIDKAANEAATSPKNNLPEPTEAQIEAGNYKKGHIKVQGIDIAVENPDGSTRTGTDKSGKTWKSKMHGHYGYFKRTEGKDGDQIDVFVGKNPKKKQDVYIVDQVNKSGNFDEHKVVMGVDSIEDAKKLYLSNYNKGWKGLGQISPLQLKEFKRWLRNGNHKKPFAKEKTEKKPPPIPIEKQIDKPKPIGRNAHGHDIYEKKDGHRYYIESGIAVESPRGVTPKGPAPADSPEILYKKGRREFLTESEINSFEKDLKKPEPEATVNIEKELASASEKDIDNILDDVFGPEPEPAIEPTKTEQTRKEPVKPEKIGKELAKKAGIESLKGVKEAVKGLSKLFGSDTTLGSGPVFNEDTYKQAKPHFDKAWDHAKQAGYSLKELAQYLNNQFGAVIKPYLKRYLMDQKEIGDGTDRVSEESIRPLEGVSPEHSETTSAGRETEGSPGRSGRSSMGRDRSDTKRSDQEPSRQGNDRLHDKSADDGASNKRSKRDRSSEIHTPTSRNYRITANDSLGEGGKITKAKNNIAAITILKKLEAEKRQATDEEKQQLVKYVGWGGMPQAFSYNYNYSRDKNQQYDKIRKALDELLTEEEYKSARASTQNAHYTSDTVISAMWDGLKRLGFKGGKVLEPGMGIGHFNGLMPDDLFKKSTYTGIEKDSISGRIAKYLYPDSTISIEGFEETKLPDNFFDITISNVPFADVKPYDSSGKYQKYKFSLHDFFFAKAIDKVRPGGLLAFITSRYTMDKQNPLFRKYMAKQADFVGAIRLPETAFKKSAETEVVTDIIILRKKTSEPFKGESWAELKEITGKDDEKIKVNEYYADNEKMMLGNMALTGSMYAAKTPTLEDDGRDLGTALSEVIQELPGDIYQNKKPQKTKQPAEETFIPAPSDIKEGNLTVHKKGIYVKENGRLVKKSIPKTPKDAKERIKGMIDIRGVMRDTLKSQYEGQPDNVISKFIKKLNVAYDSFQEKFGLLNGATNKKLFKGDTDKDKILALEKYDDDTNTAEKEAIFKGPVIQKPKPVETAGSADEALKITLNETGKVDLDHMAKLTEKDANQLLADLNDAVLLNPETGEYETKDRYLSGNVKEKLHAAIGAAKENQQFNKNVELLKEVQPEDLKATEVTARLGASWIPRGTIKEFVDELLGTRSTEIRHSEKLAMWSVIVHKDAKNTATNYEKWGTQNIGAHELIQKALNQQTPSITSYDAQSQKSVLDPQKTEAANTKLQELKDKFESWVYKDQDRREKLLRIYNDKFNNTVERKYDGSHLSLPGSNPNIQLRSTQKNAVWRIINEGKALLHHVVGAGKTFTMIGAGMEMKRLGLINKPLYVVPNHMVEQFNKEFLELYPAANVLTIGPEDVKKDRRKLTTSKIATGNWDGIVIRESAFTKIPVSPEHEKKFIEEQLEELEWAYINAKEQEQTKGGRSLVKQLEKAKDKKKEKLKKLSNRKDKDTHLVFEELGIDFMFVDEAHGYKNLEFQTKLKVAGLGQRTDVQKTLDMYMKTRYLQDLHGGEKGVVFATGTPISNSVSEMYIMLRYLAAKDLDKLGIKHFDGFAGSFAEATKEFEWSIDNSGYTERTRFRKFVNVGEMMQIYRQMSDIVLADDLTSVKLPKVKGGKPQLVTIPASQELLDLNTQLTERLQAWKRNPFGNKQGNPLAVTGQGRIAALDMRLINPKIKDDPNSKVNIAVSRIYDIWKDTKENESTQLVWINSGTPGGSAKVNLYKDIKQKLIKKGIPAKEIDFIHNHPKDEQKLKLFKNMRLGKVRVLIGSTGKMGTGMNVQKKLVAAHHLEPDWRPADMEQRDGRIIRQGNENDEVQILRYSTEKSFDTFFWQTLETKSGYIGQILKSGRSTRIAEDVDQISASFAEAMAVTSGNPLIKEKMAVDADVRKYTYLKQSYDEKIYDSQDQIKTIEKTSLPYSKKRVKELKEDIKTRTSTKLFEIVVNGKVITDKKMANKSIRAMLVNPSGKSFKVGEYAGFDITADVHSDSDFHLNIEGSGRYFLNVSNAIDYISMLDNRFKRFDKDLSNTEKDIVNYQKELEVLKEVTEETFKYDQKLKELKQRQAEITDELFGKANEAIAETPETKPEKGPDTGYYIYSSSGMKPAIKPKDVEIHPWIDTFISKSKSGEEWIVTERSTGMSVGAGTTQQKAIERAGTQLDKVGKDTILENIKEELGKRKNDGVKFSVSDTPTQPGEHHGEITKESERLRREIGREIGRKLPRGMFKTVLAVRDDNRQSPETDVAGVFGKRVVYIQNTRPDLFDFQGATLYRDPDSIFVNVDSRDPHMVIVGHELLHHLKTDSPEIYDSFLGAVFDNIKDGIDPYKDRLEKLLKEQGIEHKHGADYDYVIEELLADFIGTEMSKKAFWDKIAEKEPSIFGKVVEAIKRFLDKILSKLKDSTEKYVQDIQSARDAAVNAFAEYAKDKTDKPQGEQVKFSLPSPDDKWAENYLKDYLDTLPPDKKEASKKKIRKLSKQFPDEHAKDIKEAAISWKGDEKPDTALWDKVISTPLHHFDKVEALKRMRDHGFEQTDNYYDMIYSMTSDEQGGSYLNVIGDLKKKNPKEYKKFLKYLRNRDMNKFGYRVSAKEDVWVLKNPFGDIVQTYQVEDQAVFGMISHEMADFKKAGFSNQAVEALKSIRVISNRGFEYFMAPMRELVEQAKQDAISKGYSVKKENDGFYVYLGTHKQDNQFESESDAWDSVIALPQIGTYDAENKVVEISFKTALADMGDMRGYYMPRIRRPGRLAMIATKEGTNPIREHFDLGVRNEKGSQWKNIVNAPLPIQRRAKELAKKGYKVKIVKTEKVSEDTFEMLGPATAMFDIINAALNKTGDTNSAKHLGSLGFKTFWENNDFVLISPFLSEVHHDIVKSLGGEYVEDFDNTKYIFGNAPVDIEQNLANNLVEHETIGPSLQLKFATVLGEQVANIFKGRGARSHMIKRGEKAGQDVWIGYETDPLEAMAKYTRNISAGEAKRILANNLIRDITGTWESWQDYKARLKEGEKADYQEYRKLIRERAVESSKQPNAYKEGTTFMKDMLRNQETPDRILGALKGVAVLKYLAFRVSAPVINMTVLPTAAPAAMKAYAGIPIATRAIPVMGTAAKYHLRYRFPKLGGLPKDIQSLFEEIDRQGWLRPQYDREALSVLRSKVGRGWDSFIDTGMLMFQKTEEMNRAAVIVGTYLGIKEQKGKDFNHEEALALSKKVSDKTNAVYDKANYPHWARGQHIGAQAAKAFYVFKTFSHNYLLTMKDIGVNEKDAKAMAWMMISPAVLAGAGASILTPLVAGIAKLFGADDPEEWVYGKLNEHMGDFVERVGRAGLFGLTGVDLKGSLSIDVGVGAVPTNLVELFGAPGGVLKDMYQGAEQISKGNILKGTEKLLPLAFGNPIKAFRERFEGVTTRTNAPVFYGDEQFKATNFDAMLRMFSFNPARMSGIREKQWKERKLKFKYQDIRTDIYAKIKKFHLSSRKKSDWAGILMEIDAYNARVLKKGLPREYLITKKSIKSAIRKAYKPSKHELRRVK